MSAHAHTLDPREMAPESLRGPFLRSLLMHAALIGGAAVYAWWGGFGEAMGDPNPGGNAVGVQAVDRIPLYTRGPENPVANDTKSYLPQTPPPPKPAPAKSEPAPRKDAVPLKAEPRRPAPETVVDRSKYRPFEELAPNQLTSKTPQAVSTPLYAVPGTGNIGQTNTTLGSRFSWYAARVKELVAQAWRTQDVPASIKTAPTVIAVFEIQRNGSVAGVRLLQRSGIPTLDLSVERAIRDARLPPLPPEFDKDSASVEFWFELKR
jgi:TonB family protein